MEEQFITYCSDRVMVANVTLSRAEELQDALCEVGGVQSVTFDQDEDYQDVSALYTVTFDYADTDDQCLEALEQVEAVVSSED